MAYLAVHDTLTLRPKGKQHRGWLSSKLSAIQAADLCVLILKLKKHLSSGCTAKTLNVGVFNIVSIKGRHLTDRAGGTGNSEGHIILKISMAEYKATCGSRPHPDFRISLCFSIVFLSHIFSPSSHSIPSHLLGLCKYCHCEILRALIDDGWGLIIRASYKDVSHKINAT